MFSCTKNRHPVHWLIERPIALRVVKPPCRPTRNSRKGFRPLWNCPRRQTWARYQEAQITMLTLHQAMPQMRHEILRSASDVFDAFPLRMIRCDLIPNDRYWCSSVHWLDRITNAFHLKRYPPSMIVRKVGRVFFWKRRKVLPLLTLEMESCDVPEGFNIGIPYVCFWCQWSRSSTSKVSTAVTCSLPSWVFFLFF